MKLFTLSRLLSLLLVISNCTASAQSLADVLSSIQERKRAVQQSRQVAAYLPTMAGSSVTVPDQQLIEWTMLPNVDFPADGDVATLGIEDQVALLNQAIVEFRQLSLWYMNLRPEDLAATARIGALRPYLREDFPELGRADAGNHHALLAQLAENVMRLRVLPWPFAGKVQTKVYSIQKWEVREGDGNGGYTIVTHYGDGIQPFSGWEPASLGEGSIPTGSSGFWLTYSMASSSEVAGWQASTEDKVVIIANSNTGDYSDGNVTYSLRDVSAAKTTTYHTDAALFAKVPSRTGDQLDGKVALLTRNSWSPAATGDVSAPASWDHGDAGYQIVAIEQNATASSTLADDTQITVNLAWFACDEQGYDKRGLPSGFTALKAQMLGGSSGDWDRSYERELYHSGSVTVLQRTLHALCAPDFVQGLNAGSHAQQLAKSETLQRPPAGDASPVLHPVPGMLVGLPLGVGLEGDSLGWIGVTSGDRMFNSHDYPYDYVTSGIMYPTWFVSYVGIRFDYASNLRFCGPAQDFHVVYNTSRDPAVRGSALPSMGPTPTENASSGYGKDCFMSSWDLPRLRQIVSRDLIADVITQGHYQNTVKIYRRSRLAGAVDRTPGHLETPDPANLIRTLVFANPDAGSAAYPSAAEKIHIADGSTTHKIWQGTTGVFEWPYSSLHFKTMAGTVELFSKTIDFACDGGLVQTVTTAIDGLTASVDVSFTDTWDWEWGWWSYQAPDSVTRTAAGEVTTVNNTFDDSSPGSQDGFYPATTNIDFPDRPDVAIVWMSSGVVDSVTQGPWSTSCATQAGGALREESLFDGSLVGTTWTTWSEGGRKVKTSSAPDGLVTGMTADEVDWSELEYGNASGTGLPGLPHKLTRRDGSGMTWAWTVNGDDSTAVEVRDGLLADGSVTRGTKFIATTNPQGYPTGTESYLLLGASLKQGGTSTPTGQLSGWGAPLASKDDITGLTASRTFDGNRERYASSSDALGVTSSFTAYDALDRLTGFSWDGKAGTIAHNANGFGVSSTLAIPNRPHSSSRTWDAMGRLLTTSVTAGGTVSQTHTRDANLETTASTDSVTGADTSTVIRKADGTVATATGDTLAFGGVAGTGLTVEGGLLKSTIQLAGLEASFRTTWTDAWGRVRKTAVTGSNGGSDETQSTFSDPSSATKSVITVDAAGRHMIEERAPWAAGGGIARSGIDFNGDGSLGGSDRYVESVTTVASNKVVTVIFLNEDTGLREILRTETNPATRQTVTSINVNEETLESTTDFTTRTVTVVSSKGWTKTTAMTNLWQQDVTTVAGTGIPSATLDPSWRADGSLSGVSMTLGGATQSASFNSNGTLSGLTHPLLGNIFGGHSFANGREILSVNGITSKVSLDGTYREADGADIMSQSRNIEPVEGGFADTITPATGSATTLGYNAAGAKTTHDYAARADTISKWLAGGLLDKQSLGRGGDISFTYSPDCAKDITGIQWPAVSSTVLGESYSTAAAFTHDRAGRVKTIGDSSGSRTLAYDRGRLSNTDYTAGTLDPYQIDRHHDVLGRLDLITLKRNGTAIHTISVGHTGDSNEISGVSSGGFSATLGRDAGRHLTSYTSGSITQYWTRGAAGRIIAAGSNPTGAPTFAYTEFDGKGRRKKCTTAGATWDYTYGTAGQLTEASHPTLGTFNYAFDGIGRRGANTGSALNQFLAQTNSQQKNLLVSAAPTAQVWVNEEEIENFTGTADYAITPPGTQGGWVPWHVFAVLEGQGEGTQGANPVYNPLADPDAKSEQTGAVWVPPASESFTYDEDGNRESSALWDYGWNGRNKLVRARTKNHNSAAQGYDITFEYDAEGRRFRKNVTSYQNGSIVSQNHVTFVWDGWNIIYERHQTASGLTTLERKYVWGPDIANGNAGGAGGLYLIRETRGATTTDLHPLYDGTGHVVALADDSGTLLAKYAYGPFGEIIKSSGPLAQSNPIRYATKYFDIETGLYDFGQRYYDPVNGQWLSRELLGEDESLNLYAYCHNDPINKVDVRGLMEISTQDQANDQRVEWLLMQLAGDRKRPVAPLEMFKPYFSQTGDFGLFRPYGPEDYQRAQTMIENSGNSSMRPISWEEGELARQPVMRAGQMPDVAVRALTIGGPADPGLAQFNAGLVMPMGAGGMGFKLLLGEARALLPMLSTGAKVEKAILSAKTPAQVLENNILGNQWDDYVVATKLKNLDEAGMLGRQVRLPTPDITGKNFIKPDYTIWNSRGTVSAYADAKVLQDGLLKFDAQAQALVEWTTTTESKRLIYYVPWATQAHTNLLNYAAQRGVTIQFVVLP